MTLLVRPRPIIGFPLTLRTGLAKLQRSVSRTIVVAPAVRARLNVSLRLCPVRAGHCAEPRLSPDPALLEPLERTSRERVSMEAALAGPDSCEEPFQEFGYVLGIL